MVKNEPAADVLGGDLGDAYWVLGERVRVLAGGDRTGGAYAVGEVTVAPGGGPPPHVHRNEDELFYIIDGELGFVLGDKQIRGRAGDAVFLPRGVPHTFKNVADRPTKFFLLTTPAGFDRFVAAVGTRTDPTAPFAPPPPRQEVLDAVIAGAAAAGIQMLFDHTVTGPAALPRRSEQCWLLGHMAKLKLTGEDTRDQFTLMELASPPGAAVLTHRHVEQDELFYVLEGRYAFEIEGVRHAAPAGTFVRVPRGVWHGFVNDGPVPARLLDVHTPGGFEGFVRELGTPCGDFDAGPPAVAHDVDAVVRTILRHGMELPGRGT